MHVHIYNTSISIFLTNTYKHIYQDEILFIHPYIKTKFYSSIHSDVIEKISDDIEVLVTSSCRW